MQLTRYAGFVWRNTHIIGRDVVGAASGGLARVRDKLFDMRRDRALNIDTIGTRDHAADTSQNGDAIKYVATTYQQLEQFLADIALDGSDVVYDIGCGKGRVVCCFAQRVVQKVVGIELDATLADEARHNAERLVGRQSPIEIRTEDVLTTDLSDGTVYFLYKPFGWRTLTHVLQQIEQSLRDNPRTVRIYYFRRKEFGVLLDMCAWLTPLGLVNGTEVYGWRSQPNRTIT